MGCRFCMTGTLGFHGHLCAADILNQIFAIDQWAMTNDQLQITNLVFMGEGEPMDNLDQVLRALQIMTAPYGCAWSPKRITVSTVGIPAMKRFLDESECHLAVSMHNPFPAERATIMPAEKMMSITDVVAPCSAATTSPVNAASVSNISAGQRTPLCVMPRNCCDCSKG